MSQRYKQKKLLGVGLGAGLLGAMFVALKYAIRPASKSPVPDVISPAIFATKVLHTSLGHIVYHESGSGQPLLFIHNICIGASSYEWSKIYPEFATRFRVLAPDLVGFGESQRPSGQFSAADYVRMLAEFIRATCWEERPIIIGSGLGAGFGVYLASQHPELVSRLILLMPTGENEFGRASMPLGVKLAGHVPLLNQFIYRNYQSTRAAVRTALTNIGFVNPEAVTDEMVDVFTTCAQQYGAEHSALNFYTGRLNFDLERRLKMILHPVTLIWSDEGGYPTLDWAYKLQSSIRNCNLVVLQKTGIMAALETPQQLSAVLHEQLQTDLRIYKAG
jgi:pimeloyl-ACP methyl ester carboxylesterase